MMRRVIKVGGSLFAEPRMPSLLQKWLEQCTPATNIILAGGGSLTREIRQLDQRFGLGESWCHWRCIELMGLTSRLLGRLLPEIDRTDQLCVPSHISGGGSWLLDPGPWLQTESGIPETWCVSSDSIAAIAARRIDADELVLLKSTCPAKAASLDELAAQGFVDEYFPVAAEPIRQVIIVNLLSPALSRWSISAGPGP